MEKIISTTLELLKKKESFVISMVISHSGSTPRGTGAKMIVRENGEFIGTVGGGLVEAEVQRSAEKVFKDKQSLIKEFVLNEKDVAQMGMICGGNVTVYIKYIDAKNHLYLDVYDEAINSIKEHKHGWLITSLLTEAGKEACNQWFLTQDGTVKGTSLKDEVSEEMQKFCLKTKNIDIFSYNNSNERYIIEPIGNISTAYIFGAGHVGDKLAPLLNYVGFYTVVLDDREKFANREKFITTDEVIVLDSFDHAFENVKIDRNSYIIIVTRGHQHDKTVLGQSLRTEARYIGMIGSRKKRDKVYQSLIEEGFDKKELEKVNSPIGLDIEAETPEEIGISITAELIKIRAEKSE